MRGRTALTPVPKLERSFPLQRLGWERRESEALTVSIDYDLLAAKIAEALELGAGTPWMTVLEAAEYMRCSERFLRERLNAIPHARVDKKTLLDRRALTTG